MKAIFYNKYGGPDVLEYKEVPIPEPGNNELLLKIHAAAANPLDWHFMRGKPLMMRFMSGLVRPKHKGLGADLAAEIVRTGNAVSGFKEGEVVFGIVPKGAFAEFLTVGDTAPLQKIPEGLSFVQAAAFPIAAITALQGIRDYGKVMQGQKVLINGASGGVGTFAVQLARYYGAEVTGVCSTKNLELVRGLGASRVIDYTREDFTLGNNAYDLIFDLVGNRSVGHYRRALRPGGHCLICAYYSVSHLLQHMFYGPLSSIGNKRKVAMMPMARPNKDDIQLLAQLAQEGVLNAVIDRQYRLSETAEAIRYMETGRARGKVIISIIPEKVLA